MSEAAVARHPMRPPGSAEPHAPGAERWTFTLPFAVGVADNRRTGVLKGRVILTKRYRDAKAAAAAFAQREATRLGLRKPLVDRLALTARIWVPDRRRRDVGNMRKLITDAMKGVWYDDDQQLWKETWERVGHVAGGKIELTLERWNPEEERQDGGRR